MKKTLFLISLVFTFFLVALSDVKGQPHEFLSGDCVMCHLDEKNAPDQIKPLATESCTKCHTNIDRALSHPVDMYPYKNTIIPVDMPLTDRKLTCLTCHYAHTLEGGAASTFIRGEKSGIGFCIECHKNDTREHVTSGKAHVQPMETKISGSLDEITLLCLECHDMGRYYEWGEVRYACMSKLNHPVGVLYQKSETLRKGTFCPVGALNKNINLFEGKIGCGTCHNIYSPMRKLLVMSNEQSKLCLSCHFDCVGC